MSTRRWCVWCGPLFVVFFALGFWAVARLVPPPSPSLDARRIAEFFAHDRYRIRLGLMISMASTTFFFPFIAVLTGQLRRIEGDDSPMAYTQLAGGIGSICVFLFPLMNLQAANFRADRDPAAVAALSDIGWIPFIGLFGPPFIQCVAIAVATLRDTAPRPVFPRWVGYLNLWVALLYLPGLLLVFFQTGPLAWDGVFCWWIPAAAFFGWIVVMTAALLRTVDDPRPDPGPATHPAMEVHRA